MRWANASKSKRRGIPTVFVVLKHISYFMQLVKSEEIFSGDVDHGSHGEQ